LVAAAIRFISSWSTGARWGLTHLGGFAIAYRRRFGASPSETLRS
jgi:hypothetical protein